MQETPFAAYSKDVSSGPISSQPARRRGCTGRAAPVKSGTRNGLARRRATTDRGTTWRSVPEENVARTGSGVSGSGSVSIPAAASISRLSSAAASEIRASSASSTSSEVSRVAVLARIVATPSSRLSCSLRSASVLVVSALIRARSSRTSSATTWNLVRTDGRTLPRSTPASTSRTARASTGMMPSLSRSRTRRRDRGAVRVAPDWRWPRRANKPSSGLPRHAAGDGRTRRRGPRRDRVVTEPVGPGRRRPSRTVQRTGERGRVEDSLASRRRPLRCWPCGAASTYVERTATAATASISHGPSIGREGPVRRKGSGRG